MNITDVPETAWNACPKSILNLVLTQDGREPGNDKAAALDAMKKCYIAQTGTEPVTEPTEDPSAPEGPSPVLCQAVMRGHIARVWYWRFKPQLKHARAVFDSVKYVYCEIGPYSREEHYQVGLQKELESKYSPNSLSRENVCAVHYKHTSGRVFQLDSNLSSRTDLTIDDEKVGIKTILELKAIAKLKDEAYFQLKRYLREAGDAWTGMLINFGHKACNVVIYQPGKDMEQMRAFEYSVTWDKLN